LIAIAPGGRAEALQTRIDRTLPYATGADQRWREDFG
jgi:hypothetical protein